MADISKEIAIIPRGTGDLSKRAGNAQIRAQALRARVRVQAMRLLRRTAIKPRRHARNNLAMIIPAEIKIKAVKGITITDQVKDVLMIITDLGIIRTTAAAEVAEAEKELRNTRLVRKLTTPRRKSLFAEI